MPYRDQPPGIEVFDARTGRRVRRLTPRGRAWLEPAVSPDSRRVVFLANPGGFPEDRADVCIVALRGGRARCPVRQTREPDRPVWGG